MYMELMWCVPSCNRKGKAKLKCWTLTCTHCVAMMAENFAAMHLGINPEQPPEGACFVCKPLAFPAGLVLAKEVVTSLAYYCQLRDGASHNSDKLLNGQDQEGEELVNGAFTNGM